LIYYSKYTQIKEESNNKKNRLLKEKDDAWSFLDER